MERFFYSSETVSVVFNFFFTDITSSNQLCVINMALFVVTYMYGFRRNLSRKFDNHFKKIDHTDGASSFFSFMSCM